MAQHTIQPPAIPQMPLQLGPPSTSSTSDASRQPSSGQVFDFTKRKRWADLLVTELTEVIMLVLSETGVVWYCGPAVEDLLGWKDEELVDGDFCEIMNDSDRRTFRRQFTECIDSRGDLEAYVRLRCKSEDDLYPSLSVMPTLAAGLNARGGHQSKSLPKEVLFEIKAYPHYVMSSSLEALASGSPYGRDDPDMQMFMRAGPSSMRSTATGMFKCVFAMARPYPSRNTAMLNTFLELKMENERLQQRLRDLKAKSEAVERAKIESQYIYQSYGGPQAGGLPQSYSSTFPLDSAAGSTSSFEGFYGYGDNGSRNSGGIAPTASSSSQVQQDEGDPSSDHTLPRKKSKKSLAPEQYCCMTCGRTDSPEWRKGPRGAKTLCNACGLRWAKQVRTKDPKDSKDPARDGEGDVFEA